MNFPMWLTNFTPPSKISGPDDTIADLRNMGIDAKQTPQGVEVSVPDVAQQFLDGLKSKAQSLADKATVAQVEADTAKANADAAKNASDAALQAVFDAEQIQRKAKADELAKVAADAAQVAALAQAAAVAAQTSASEARAEFQGDQQTCPNCGTLIPGLVRSGLLVNCPKCDRNFPAL